MRFPNTVINFHVIQEARWMEKILKLLANRYQMINARELEQFYFEDLRLENACHITVDDGDISVYTHLFPLIKKYRVPISIYVSPVSITTGRNFWFQEIEGYNLGLLLDFYNKRYGKRYPFESKYQVYALIKSLEIKEIHQLINEFKELHRLPDKPRRSMSLQHLLDLKSSGLVEIGAHTMHHPILKNETSETVDNEIRQSVEKLSEILNQEVKYFAYPNGAPVIDFGKREMDVLKDCGVKLAFSTEPKNFSIQDNPLSVPRRGITKGGPWFVLTKLILGDRWEYLRRLLKGKQEHDFRMSKGE